ncbi:MAG: methyl-accepting chemotaxis protein [Nitrospirae bacterium]|nr:methyl-accepting chemotaxis protein [Nitrospirota bacterium]
MKLNKFADMKIRTKVMSVSMLIVILCLGGVLTFYLPYAERNIIKKQEEGLSNLTDVVIALLTEYNERCNNGEYDLPEIQKRAKARIKNLRYRQKEYFWINDDKMPYPTMIMHPTVPALEGKTMDDAKFSCATSLKAGPDGATVKTDGKKNMFQAFAEVANSKEGGYVTYDWAKPLPGGGVSKEVYPKLSFVKKFQPWGWIVGTGLYIDDVADEIAAARMKIILSTSVFAALAMMLSWFVANKITSPLQQAVDISNQLSQGNLGVEINVDSRDEVGQLLLSMRTMVENLKKMITAIKTAADTVSSDSHQLSANAEQMSNGVIEESGRASQIATASEEMSRTVIDIARNASQMAEAAENTVRTAKDGGEIVEKSVQEVKAIANTVNESAEMVKLLGERSKQIGDIVVVIKDIADQTNLLALNAAIEAARAGEQGRGFAVVADEVRKLAERTAKATSEISEMIHAIQEEVGKTVVSMDEGTKRVEVGVEYATKAGTALSGIVSSIDGLRGIVNQIASATEEMSTVSETISSDIETVASVSKETSASSAQIAKAATDLAHLSSDLKGIVTQFKV